MNNRPAVQAYVREQLSYEQKPDSCTIVIFGASGDLTHRKLMPALFALHMKKMLPERVSILGVARSNISDEEFCGMIRKAVTGIEGGDAADVDAFAAAATIWRAVTTRRLSMTNCQLLWKVSKRHIIPTATACFIWRRLPISFSPSRKASATRD